MKDRDLVVCINTKGWADEKAPFKRCEGPKKDDILTVEYQSTKCLVFYEWPGYDDDGTRCEWAKDQFVPLDAPSVEEIVQAINSAQLSNTL